MPTIDLVAGLDPLNIQVNLDPDSDFVYSLQLSNSQQWPTTQSLSFQFTIPNTTPTTWNSVLSSDKLTQSWKIESTDVATLLAANPDTVKLLSHDTATTPATDLLWGFGNVVNLSG